MNLSIENVTRGLSVVFYISMLWLFLAGLCNDERKKSNYMLGSIIFAILFVGFCILKVGLK